MFPKYLDTKTVYTELIIYKALFSCSTRPGRWSTHGLNE